MIEKNTWKCAKLLKATISAVERRLTQRRIRQPLPHLERWAVAALLELRDEVPPVLFRAQQLHLNWGDSVNHKKISDLKWLSVNLSNLISVLPQECRRRCRCWNWNTSARKTWGSVGWQDGRLALWLWSLPRTPEQYLHQDETRKFKQ